MRRCNLFATCMIGMIGLTACHGEECAVPGKLTNEVSINAATALVPTATVRGGVVLFENIGIDLPNDVETVFITARTTSGADIGVDSLQTPACDAYFGPGNNDDAPIRPFTPNFGAIGLQIPSTDREAAKLVGPGRYRLSLWSRRSDAVTLDVTKVPPLTTEFGLIDLMVTLVGDGNLQTPGLPFDADSAPGHLQMDRFLAKIDALLAPAKIRLRSVTFKDLIDPDLQEDQSRCRL